MAYRLGFIGAGNMAEAIARAAIEKGVLRPEQMMAADPDEGRRGVFDALGVVTAAENKPVIQQSEQLMLAVKPQKMDAPAADIAAFGATDQILISIMAGIGTVKLAQAIGASRRIVRVMPNTPVMVGYGVAGIALGETAEPGDDELTVSLFGAGGKAVRLAETKLDAITAVCGSGPGYVFYLAEAMENAARRLGLEEEAAELVAQTVLGGAHLLSESDESAATLRQKVMSPGGTTEAAIKHFEGEDMGSSIVKAIQAAENRSRELGG